MKTKPNNATCVQCGEVYRVGFTEHHPPRCAGCRGEVTTSPAYLRAGNRLVKLLRAVTSNSRRT